MSDSTYRIRLTVEAKAELDGIFRYIAEELGNPQAAAKFDDKFRDRIKRLREWPLSCPVLIHNNIYRKLLIDKYIVFYTVDEGTKTVYIQNVIYGMSDYAKYF